jgi:hypothetical protein
VPAATRCSASADGWPARARESVATACTGCEEMAVIGQHRPPTVPATWHRGSRGGLARGRRPAHPRARFRHRKRRAGRSGLAHVTWRHLTDRTDLRVVQRAYRELAHRRQGGSALRPPGADPRISAPDRRLRRSAWHGHHSAFFCLARAHRHSRGGCTRDWSSGPSRVAYRASRTPRSPTPELGVRRSLRDQCGTSPLVSAIRPT